MNKRMIEFDTMKIMLIALVVFAHVTRMYTPAGVVSINTQSVFLENLTDFIYLFHMPAFVAVSGAVFHYTIRERNKRQKNKTYILDKFKKLLIPYFFFTLFYVLPTLIVIGEVKDVISYTARNVFLLGGPNHLWYAVMIFNVFVVFHVIEGKVNASPPIIVMFVFISINFLSFLVPNIFQATNTFNYGLYFYLGYGFRQHKDKMNINNNLILVALSSFFVLVLIYVGLYHTQTEYINYLIWVMKLVAATSGALFIYSFSNCISRFVKSDAKIFKNINADIFGIYLFHPMIIYLLFYAIRDIQHNPYLITISFTFISFILSMLLVRLFRILGVNILIGESTNAIRTKVNA